MLRPLLITVGCLLLILAPVQAQQTTAPFVYSPPTQAQAPADLTVPLIAALTVVLSAAAAYVGGWFVRRGQREKTQDEFDERARKLKADIEAQAVLTQDTLRTSLLERIDELKREVAEVRELLRLKDEAWLECQKRVQTLEGLLKP